MTLGRKPWSAAAGAVLGVLLLAAPASAAPAPPRPLLSNPDLFFILASEKDIEAFRLRGFWRGSCDSLRDPTSSPFDCFERAAEVSPQSRKAVPNLITLLSRCTWVRYRGGGLQGAPTLGFRLGGDNLAVDLVVWLDRRRAVLSRAGEGWYTAAIPESLVTDVVWCLWAVDPEHPDLAERIAAEMRRRGLSPKDAPPPDVHLVDDFLREDPVVKDDREAKDDPETKGEFVYYEDAPAPVTQVPPVYPEMAREAGIEGRVVLHVLVGRDGRVKSVKVMRSVTMLDGAAVDAVKKWVFKPALSNNKPVAVWVEVPVDFPPR